MKRYQLLHRRLQQSIDLFLNYDLITHLLTDFLIMILFYNAAKKSFIYFGKDLGKRESDSPRLIFSGSNNNRKSVLFIFVLS